MVTTVIKSIGTGGAPHDYSTIQSWEDALPSDLTASRSGQTLQAGSTTGNAVLDAGASAVNSFYNGLTITVSGEERLITAYVGATKTATIGALNGSSATWSGAPSAGTAFTINSVSCQGECYYNAVAGDGEFTATGPVVSIAGETVDSTHTITLTAAAGQSFADNANVQTNALFYAAANGVALRKTTNYNSPVTVGVTCFLSRLQLKTGGGNSGATGISQTGGFTATVNVDKCIIECAGTNQGGAINLGSSWSIVATNSVFYAPALQTNGKIVQAGTAVTCEFCTLIGGGAASGTVGMRNNYNSAIVKNCLIYGVLTPASVGGGTLTSTTNQSNVSATGFTVQTAASQFVNTASDFRLKWTAPAKAAATADATYPTDIAGTARPQGSNWDIGAWQLAVTTKSIGTGGAPHDYSTIQAWEDALPATLVTAQVGECHYNTIGGDGEFSRAGTIVTISGETTDSTHTITLKCAAGQSFCDNANVQTNALRYNASNGVAMKCTAGYVGATIVVSSVNFVTLDGLQIAGTGGGSSNTFVNTTSLANNLTIQNCILDGIGKNVNDINVGLGGASTNVMRNCLVICSAFGSGVDASSNASVVNCTIVKPSNLTASASPLNGNYGTSIVRNCAIFGFAVAASGGFNADGHNACETGGIIVGSTGNLTSVPYTTATFVQPSRASGLHDFRILTGSALVDAGVTDTTHIPAANDIAGTSRPQGSAWDIGAWELVVAPVVSNTDILLGQTWM